MVTVWREVQTQWRYAGADGVPTGLDYTGVRAHLQALGRWPDRDLWTGLLVCEAETLAVWGERRAKAQRAAQPRQVTLGRG